MQVKATLINRGESAAPTVEESLKDPTCSG